MVYRGKVSNGTVVLEAGARIPDGTEVQVELPPPVSAESLLEEPTLDDALDKLYLLYKVHCGIRQADAGQTVSHEEARERLKKWLD